MNSRCVVKYMSLYADGLIWNELSDRDGLMHGGVTRGGASGGGLRYLCLTQDVPSSYDVHVFQKSDYTAMRQRTHHLIQ